MECHRVSQAVGTREAYQQEWQELKRKKAEKGSNPYEQMKPQMGL